MKILTKGVYYHKLRESDTITMWHDCKNYKNRAEDRRVFIKPNEREGDTTNYTCGYCDFVYPLDMNLTLIESSE